MATIIDGKALAAKIMQNVKEQAENLASRPALAVILVGDDPASRTYVNGKKKDCAQCGIFSDEYILHAQTSQSELLRLIDVLNNQQNIDGILVQSPLPKHIDKKAVQTAIRPDKDVDCFHPHNMGQLMAGEDGFLPCTPAAVMRLLEEYNIDPSGKRCAIVGRSNVVGKPLAMLMLQKNATVTICHTKTADLKAECLRADILIAAAGHPGLITEDMVRNDAVVIDIGINVDAQGKLCGDVDFEEVAKQASFITPVPGGVGPVTRAMLMENTLIAAKKHGK